MVDLPLNLKAHSKINSQIQVLEVLVAYLIRWTEDQTLVAYLSLCSRTTTINHHPLNRSNNSNHNSLYSPTVGQDQGLEVMSYLRSR